MPKILVGRKIGSSVAPLRIGSGIATLISDEKRSDSPVIDGLTQEALAFTGEHKQQRRSRREAIPMVSSKKLTTKKRAEAERLARRMLKLLRHDREALAAMLTLAERLADRPPIRRR